VLADPAVRQLRYICVGGSGRTKRAALYAQLRYKHPVTGEWQSKSLGRMPEPQEIGELDVYTPDAALEPFRERARGLLRKVHAGVDPRSEAGPEGLTLRQALALHAQRSKNLGRSERSIRFYEESCNSYLADWLDVPLRKLTRPMVRERHEAIGKKALKGLPGRGGRYAANGAMRTVRAVWNTARREDATLPESPTIAVTMHKEKRRESAIPLTQLPRWCEEVTALKNELKRDYYLLAALTGLRRGSLSSIRQSDIDLTEGTLHVPMPKGGPDKAFTLPLSDTALAVVERRLRASPDSPWLFSAASRSGHIRDPRPESADGFTVSFTVHGLRATYISAAHAAGVSDRHVMLLANHAVPKADVHGGYILPDSDALRPSQQRITDYLRKHGLAL
jgi:Site-specific recombinase XerD